MNMEWNMTTYEWHCGGGSPSPPQPPAVPPPSPLPPIFLIDFCLTGSSDWQHSLKYKTIQTALLTRI